MNQNIVPCSGWIIFHNMDLSHFLYPFIKTTILGGFCFWLLWITLLRTFIQKFLHGNMFSLFLGTYLEWVFGSCSISLLNFLINCQTVFQSSCPILLSNQQCMRVSISSSVLLIIFFIIAILVGVTFYLIVTLIFLIMLSLLAVLYFLWTNISLNP